MAAVLVSGASSERNVQQRHNANSSGEHADSRPQADSDVEAGRAAAAGACFEFEPPSATYERKSAASESLTLLRLLWRSGHRLRIVLLASGIAGVLVANMVGQIRLNQWNGSFFDALAQRNFAALAHELLIFLAIVGALLALVVGQTWMQQMMKVRLREWLTHHLLDEWLVAGRAYRLGLAGEIGVNPDQRIEEDTRKLTELSAGLGVGLFQAVLLLVSFISILWALSSHLVFNLRRTASRSPATWCGARSSTP